MKSTNSNPLSRSHAKCLLQNRLVVDVLRAASLSPSLHLSCHQTRQRVLRTHITHEHVIKVNIWRSFLYNATILGRVPPPLLPPEHIPRSPPTAARSSARPSLLRSSIRLCVTASATLFHAVVKPASLLLGSPASIEAPTKSTLNAGLRRPQV